MARGWWLPLMCLALAAQEAFVPSPPSRTMEPLELLEPEQPKDPSAFWRLAPAPPPSPPDRRLDGGLLDPAWFGPGPDFKVSEDGQMDAVWAAPELRMDRPVLFLAPWELPSLPSGKDPLDGALAGAGHDGLQRVLAQVLEEQPGLRQARDPSQTPYHLVGRVVGATHIRQGALATFGLFAGLPTLTWDAKLVDVRTGAVLLATHHRAVAGNPYPWSEFITAQVAALAGLPPLLEEGLRMPKGSTTLEDGSQLWQASPAPLRLDALSLRPWRPNTGGAGGLWALWAHGMGHAFARGMRPALAEALQQAGIAEVPPPQATLELGGQVVNPPSRFFTHYQAWLREPSTGKELLRLEVRAPTSASPCGPVARRVVEELLRLRAPSADGPPPDLGAPAPERWAEVERLSAQPAAPGLAWVDPAFSLRGSSLHVGDWRPPALGKEATPIDRAYAEGITLQGPGWLLGPLAQQATRGFALSRTEGVYRVEGRVLEISESDLGDPATMLGAAFTFGLSAASHAVLQVRIVDTATGRTMLLIQKEVESFKVASSGTDYKAMKWLAQDVVPWLLRVGPPE